MLAKVAQPAHRVQPNTRSICRSLMCCVVLPQKGLSALDFATLHGNEASVALLASLNNK